MCNQLDLRYFLQLAIKLLKSCCNNRLNHKTNIKYLKAGKEKLAFSFDINDEEIIPIFDVPHLLKGLRNNLLTKYLYFTYENKDELDKE